MNNNWINCDKELPPCDGKYHITNLPKTQIWATVEYDGYGFISLNHYITPQFWRHPKSLEKKYGKIEPTEELNKELQKDFKEANVVGWEAGFDCCMDYVLNILYRKDDDKRKDFSQLLRLHFLQFHPDKPLENSNE
jgi:hypothetical protein